MFSCGRSRPISGGATRACPSRDAAGRTRLSNPPLALDLHYLITAYGAADLHAEIVLGYAMQLLHETPVLTRDAIRVALQRPPDDEATLPSALRALAGSGLQDQVEQLRITPEFLNTEELSKFWTAAQARYRSSAAYQVSVVLIQATDPTRSPLPVLERQVFVQPDLLPPVPTIDAVVPDAKQPVAQLGTTIGLKGHHLDGTGREVILVNDRFEIEETLPAPTGGDETSIAVLDPRRAGGRLSGRRLPDRRAHAAARRDRAAGDQSPGDDDCAEARRAADDRHARRRRHGDALPSTFLPSCAPGRP